MVVALPILLALNVSAASPTRVLVMDFKAEGGSEAVRVLVQDEVAQRVSKEHLETLTTKDIQHQLDVEAQKRAVGCGDESCFVEIANALGAEFTIYGNIAVIDGLTVVNMVLLDAHRQVAMGRESAQARTADDLIKEVQRATHRLVAPIAPPHGPPVLGITGVSVAGLGFVTAAVGAALAIEAWVVIKDAKVLSREGAEAADKERALDRFDLGLLVGGIGLGVIAGGTVFAVATWE